MLERGRSSEGSPFRTNRLEVMTLEEFFVAHPKRLKRMRWRIYLSKGFACVYPGCKFRATHCVIWRDRDGSTHMDPAGGPDLAVMLTLDHRIPKALGGKRSFSNLFPMCEICNSEKAADLLYY